MTSPILPQPPLRGHSLSLLLAALLLMPSTAPAGEHVLTEGDLPLAVLAGVALLPFQLRWNQEGDMMISPHLSPVHYSWKDRLSADAFIEPAYFFHPREFGLFTGITACYARKWQACSEAGIKNLGAPFAGGGLGLGANDSNMRISLLLTTRRVFEKAGPPTQWFGLNLQIAWDLPGQIVRTKRDRSSRPATARQDG